MRLTLGNLQALQRLAIRAEGSTIDVREDGYELRVRYAQGAGGRDGLRKQREMVVNRRDSTVTVRSG